MNCHWKIAVLCHTQTLCWINVFKETKKQYVPGVNTESWDLKSDRVVIGLVSAKEGRSQSCSNQPTNGDDFDSKPFPRISVEGLHDASIPVITDDRQGNHWYDTGDVWQAEGQLAWPIFSVFWNQLIDPERYANYQDQDIWYSKIHDVDASCSSPHLSIGQNDSNDDEIDEQSHDGEHWKDNVEELEFTITQKELHGGRVVDIHVLLLLLQLFSTARILFFDLIFTYNMSVTFPFI